MSNTYSNLLSPVSHMQKEDMVTLEQISQSHETNKCTGVSIQFQSILFTFAVNGSKFIPKTCNISGFVIWNLFFLNACCSVDREWQTNAVTYCLVNISFVSNVQTLFFLSNTLCRSLTYTLLGCVVVIVLKKYLSVN